jgi:serine/threonine protein kinase
MDAGGFMFEKRLLILGLLTIALSGCWGSSKTYNQQNHNENHGNEDPTAKIEPQQDDHKPNSDPMHHPMDHENETAPSQPAQDDLNAAINFSLQIANPLHKQLTQQEHSQLLEACNFAFQNGWNSNTAIQEFVQVWLYLLENPLAKAAKPAGQTETFQLQTITQMNNSTHTKDHTHSSVTIIRNEDNHFFLPKYPKRLGSGCFKHADAVLSLQENQSSLQPSTIAMLTPQNFPEAIKQFQHEIGINQDINQKLNDFYKKNHLKKIDQPYLSTGKFIDFDYTLSGVRTGALFQPVLGKDLAWFSKSYDNPHQFLPWMLDVAHALAVLHAIGMVHADLKLENIMISKDEHNAYLSDFGFTHNLPDDQRHGPDTIGFNCPLRNNEPEHLFVYLTSPYQAEAFYPDVVSFGLLLLRASKKLRHSPTAEQCNWEHFDSLKGCAVGKLDVLSSELEPIAQKACGNELICYERIVAQALQPDPKKRISIDSAFLQLRKIITNPHTFEQTAHRLQEL